MSGEDPTNANAQQPPTTTTAGGGAEGQRQQDPEAYVDFMNQVQDEQKQFPLISPLVPVDVALQDLESASEELRRKAASISKAKNYASLRAVRRDGSCFIRAVSFRTLEVLMLRGVRVGKMDDAIAFRQFLKNDVLPRLIKLFGEYAEDFADAFDGILESIIEGKIKTSEELREAVIQPDNSEYIVCYLRYCISSWMRTHPDDFMPFVVEHPTIEAYCSAEVECVGKECDQLHITAFCSMFNLPLTVEYIDAQDGQDATTHQFGPAKDPAAVKSIEDIVLLYRPGHYDILYP